jgi:hypothetical protein
MTEHPSKDMDTSAQTLDGMHGGVLFIAGSEIDATGGDRLLMTGKQFDAQALNHNDPLLTQNSSTKLKRTIVLSSSRTRNSSGVGRRRRTTRAWKFTTCTQKASGLTF